MSVDLRLMDAALGYAEHSWPVLALHGWTGSICTCGQDDCASPAKHPRTRNGLKDASTSSETIRSWWARWPDANIGIRTGVAFDVIDVDGDDGFVAIQAMEEAHGDLAPGPTTLTGGGGTHRFYLPTGIGNRAGIIDHVDWRGRNGYIVAPPSMHSSGDPYEWHPDWGADTELTEVTGWLHELLFPPAPPPFVVGAAKTTSMSKTDAYARRAFDAELGELARAAQGVRNNTLNDCAFSLYQLVYGGELDENEVTQALTRVGIATGLAEREVTTTLGSARQAARDKPRSAPKLTVVGSTALKTAAPAAPRLEPGPAAAPNPKSGPAHEAEPTGWEPVDVAEVIAKGCEIPPPSLYERDDHVCLFYAGRMHALNGEPESGKSWVAQHACAQVLSGNHACYIDFEDTAESVIARLLALGCDGETLSQRLTYIAPDRPIGDAAATVLRTRFATHRPVVVIIDGVTEAMSIMGLNPIDNADTAKFFRLLPRGLSRMGAAVILIDHVNKDADQRGRWALGAQHKMAVLTGAAYTVETAMPFGRGRSGMAKILVTKDKPGYIRQHASGTLVAELRIASRGDAVTATLCAPRGTGDEFRPTGIMEKISRRLEHGPALTLNQIRGAVKGRNEHIDLALRLLTTEGHVVATKQGQSRFHSVEKPFRADDDPMSREATDQHEMF